MEDLSGGSLSLEQRYEIGKLEGIFVGVHVYRGTQQPMSKPIWIHAIPHPSKDQSIQQEWVEKIRHLVLKASQFRDPSFYEIIDFGAVDGAPFIVYERDNFHRLSQVLEVEGILEGPVSQLICSGIATACLRLDQRGLTHGSINPSFVFLGEEGEVKLIQSGFGFSRSLLDELGSNTRDALYAYDSDGNNTDAYGIACLTYELLSGVHPFLDAQGDWILESPSHPAEFGADMSFAENLLAQFDAETRNLEALISKSTPEPEQEPKETTVELSTPTEPPPKTRKNQKVTDFETPRPKKGPLFWIAIGIMGILIGILFYQSMQIKNERKEAELVRPTTMTLTSTPKEAEVFLNEKTIGMTPFEIDPNMLNAMKLKIRKEGFTDQEITISANGNRPQFNVSLKK